MEGKQAAEKDTKERLHKKRGKKGRRSSPAADPPLNFDDLNISIQPPAADVVIKEKIKSKKQEKDLEQGKPPKEGENKYEEDLLIPNENFKKTAKKPHHHKHIVKEQPVKVEKAACASSASSLEKSASIAEIIRPAFQELEVEDIRRTTSVGHIDEEEAKSEEVEVYFESKIPLEAPSSSEEKGGQFSPMNYGIDDGLYDISEEDKEKTKKRREPKRKMRRRLKPHLPNKTNIYMTRLGRAEVHLQLPNPFWPEDYEVDEGYEGDNEHEDVKNEDETQEKKNCKKWLVEIKDAIAECCRNVSKHKKFRKSTKKTQLQHKTDPNISEIRRFRYQHAFDPVRDYVDMKLERLKAHVLQEQAHKKELLMSPPNIGPEQPETSAEDMKKDANET